MEKTKIKPIPPLISQMIKRDLGKYGGQSGINKLYDLICAIDMMIANVNYDFMIESFNRKLLDLKLFEEKTKEPTIYKRLVDWKTTKLLLDNLRPKLAEVKIAYDDIKDKEMKGKEETKKKINYKKITRRVSPYQPEIYFVFNFLCEITDMQRQTIPAEAFRTVEQSKYIKQPFARPNHPQPLPETLSSQENN
jgi:hypothetical protein